MMHRLITTSHLAAAVAMVTLSGANLLLTPAAMALEAPPPLSAPHPFELPSKVDYELANGLTVTLVPFSTIPKATILIDANTGYVADQDPAGLSALVAELLKEGAGSHTGQQLASLFADMGGALSVTANLNDLTFETSILSERIPRALGLMADVLRRPTLPADALPRLKKDLTRTIAIQRAQAGSIASEAFARILWGPGPFGHDYPSDSEIAALTHEQVRHYLLHRLGARRTHIYIAGQFDQSAVENALRIHFGTWSAGSPPEVNVPHSMGTRTITLIDRPGAAQSTILMGLPVTDVTHEHFTDLSVANSLLGGSLLSRLNQNLREAKGYTYGANSQLTPYHGLSTWTISSDVNTPDTAAALHEIFIEMSRLTSELSASEELQRIKNYRAGHFVLSASSRTSLLGQLQFIDQHQLPDDWLTHYVVRTNAVTPTQVLDAAHAAWSPETMTLVIVGDLAKIRAPLQALQELQGIDFHSPGME